MKKINFGVFLVTIVVIQFCMHIISDAQSKDETKNTAKISKQKVSDLKEIKTNFQVSNYEFTNIEDVLAQPAPDIWLVVPCPKETAEEKVCDPINSRAEISLEGREIIANYWKNAVIFRYKLLRLNKNYEGNENYQLSLNFSETSQEVAEELEKIFVDTLDGRKLLTSSEANSIIEIINKNSVELNEQISVNN